MSVMPFICLGIGILLGIFIKSKKFEEYASIVSTIALCIMMFAIGINIGLNQTVMDNLLSIGINCFIIALGSIALSVVLVVLLEKTIIPLEQIDDQLAKQHLDLNDANLEQESSEGGLNLVYLIPASVILGLILSLIFKGFFDQNIIDQIFTYSLITLYICVGIAQGANKDVFIIIKKLKAKVLLLPLAITLGSLLAGVIFSFVLNIPMQASLLSSAGMCFYSLTGAFMTETYGLEIGAYGFLVNIFREFLTVLLLPILIKISKGSPMAAGGAGNMDTMLAPITKFVGLRLGLVTLVTGVILTIVVPVILPILAMFL